MIPRDPDRVLAFCEKVRGLAPIIERHRESFDSLRHLPRPVFEALADSGLLRLWLPKALDGPELSPLDFMEVVEAASELDGSVGWIVGNGAGISRVGGYVAADVAQAWFADPHAFIAAATGAVGSAVPVERGYRVSGRWPFGSGIHNATRLMGLCAIAEADSRPGPRLIACYFAPADATVIDNWHVSGLRGTGSCDFEARDVFVPIEHTHDFTGHHATQPGLLYRLPGVSVFSWSVSVVPLGIARSVITSFKAVANRKVRGGSSAPLADREIVQDGLGRAETLHAAARSLLVTAMSELMAATDADRDRLVQARVRFRAACAFAAESAVRVVDSLAAMAGTATIFETSPLERCVRDVHAAVKHAAMGPSTYLLAGKLSLGRELGAARF